MGFTHVNVCVRERWGERGRDRNRKSGERKRRGERESKGGREGERERDTERMIFHVHSST